MENLHLDDILSTYAAIAIFSALLQAMPPPNGNKWYNFLYRFLHALAANWDKMRLPAKPKEDPKGVGE